jgi:hypothetical protein
MIQDLWYKNAIVYCLSVGTYMDADGDGMGDFQGLMRRLDYLHGLGVTAIWLIRFWLLAALISHAVMRVWSLLDFVPKALTFERADPGTITESTARRWTRRSLWRLPLDMVTCASMLAAFAAAVEAP